MQRQLSKSISNLQFMKQKEEEKIAKQKEQVEEQKKQEEHWTVPAPTKPRKTKVVLEETVSTTSVGRRKYGQQPQQPPQTKEETEKKRSWSQIESPSPPSSNLRNTTKKQKIG